MGSAPALCARSQMMRAPLQAGHSLRSAAVHVATASLELLPPLLLLLLLLGSSVHR